MNKRDIEIGKERLREGLTEDSQLAQEDRELRDKTKSLEPAGPTKRATQRHSTHEVAGSRD